MVMRAILDFPRLPRWGTNSGRTVEPGETDKDLGHVVGTRPPARWNNDMQKLNYEWFQFLSSTTIANISTVTRAGTTDLQGTIALPSTTGLTRIMAINTTGVYESVDAGDSWDGKTPTPLALSSPRCVAIDAGNGFIVGGAGDSIYYSGDLSGGWSTDSGPATPLTGITAIETAYPDSDFIVAGDTSGNVAYASSVGTSWTPATKPSYVTAGNDRAVIRFMKVGTNSWILIAAGGEVFLSTDGCATWAAKTRITISDTITHASYNEDTGRLIVIGETSTPEIVIWYSDNQGDTWTAATAPSLSDCASPCIYCAGGNLWLAAATHVIPGLGYLMGSYDDGKTWGVVTIPNTTYDGAFDFACTGREIIIAAAVGYGFKTTSLLRNPA